MLVLGIETTCDETAAAVVRDGGEILSNVVASQMELHRPYKGVVPELASRHHLSSIAVVIRQAINEAGIALQAIDRIAVAQGPGLVGALLVGINTAKGMTMGLNCELVGVNHVEAHLYAALMERKAKIPFPALGIVVSGGHTALLRVDGVGQYALISTTVDDAIGEAFDKVAAMLGLPYPGGPAVEQLALTGDPGRYTFRAGRVKEQPLAFSFSGLKTSVLYTVKGVGSDKHSPLKLAPQELPHVAAAFQEAAFGDLMQKVLRASEQHCCQSLIVGGGVSNNQRLRTLLEQCPLPVFWPPHGLSLDNAAMIAGLGYQKDPSTTLELVAQPRLQPFWL